MLHSHLNTSRLVYKPKRKLYDLRTSDCFYKLMLCKNRSFSEETRRQIYCYLDPHFMKLQIFVPSSCRSNFMSSVKTKYPWTSQTPHIAMPVLISVLHSTFHPRISFQGLFNVSNLQVSYGKKWLLLAHTYSWRTTPRLLSATAYSVHLQPHFILVGGLNWRLQKTA
jgi:hypothetical protein